MQTSFKLTTAVAALLSATSVSAAAVSTCASDASNVCYALGVPSTTAASNTGNLYFQISAPTSYQWVALGMGTNQMAGANMFIMYTNGAGNVTVSNRLGTGHVQPQYQASSASDITLLAGSGVTGNTMVANVLCTNCKSWSGGSLSTSSTSAQMIGAWKEGSALDSTDLSQSIEIHSGETGFQMDLTQATLADDSNPFTSAAAATTTTGSSGSATTTTTSGAPNKKIIWAHGLGMGLVFAVLYPVGSALMPLLGKWRLHAGFQVVTWLAMWAFFGLGVYGAQVRNLLFNNNHTLLGTVVVCLLAIQPALGQLHHQHFTKVGARGVFSYVHLWFGRSLLVLGTINGGLGLQLSYSKQSLIIAYSVISVVFYLFYAGVKGFAVVRKGKRSSGTRKSSSNPSVAYGDDVVPTQSYTRQVEEGKHRG